VKHNLKRTLIATFITVWIYYSSIALFPHLPISPFIPLIILLFYEEKRSTTTWSTFAIACFLDLTSSHAQFGVLTLSYCISTWILYQYKSLFFIDKWSTLPILSGLYSAISTFTFFILLNIYDVGFSFSWTWFFTDIILLSLFDSLYAFLYFTIPLRFIPHRVSQGNSFLFKRRPH
jgi:hypothetical protein